MYKPGSIRKVTVKNFVTYSFVEMHPGPHLNMIIGPNGTGKSTIVAAIILGLGGNPKIVGRGTKISEYVKHNCDSATINIFLQDERDNTYIKVTREFDTQDRTTWWVNNQRVKIDNVMECIQQFNIQVNNLCQFLPQDRVQDFAKLNKQDLLKETQRALCRFDLLEKQENLVKSRVAHKELLETLDNYVKKLQEAQEANVRLEGKVKNFNKKKKYNEYIQHIDRKISWTRYEEYRVRLVEVKKDRNKAQEQYDRYKNAMRPMEQEMAHTQKEISALQQTNSKATQLIRNIESTINTWLEKVDGLKVSVRRIDDDMNSKLAEIEQWDKEIDNSVNKLEELKVSQKEIQAKCDASEKEKLKWSTEMNKLKAHQKTHEDKQEEIAQAKQDDCAKIRAMENETNRLENVKQNRLQQLQRLNEHAYQAVIWLKSNKHLFQDEIYDPIMLEVNVLDNTKAKYVENVIPVRDRLAFTCVNKEDMNKLIRCLREDQNLTVNIIHSGRTGESLNQFQPTIPIERLRKYGFYTYVNNLFTAPEPIMRYLCKAYRLHNIPVGDNTTNACYENIPKEVRQFFSDKYRYSISFSKYSGQKSTRQSEVVSDGGLSHSLDVLRLENLKGRMNDIKQAVVRYDTQLQTLQGQLSKINEKIGILREKIKDIQREQQNAQTITSRIQMTERKIREMQQNKKSPDDIRDETKEKVKRVLQSMGTIQEGIKNEARNLSTHINNSLVTSLKIDDSRKKLAFLENKTVENRRQCQEAEERLNIIKDQYSDVMNQAKAILNKAKALSRGFTPADDGFDEFRDHFDRLSNNMEELNTERDQLQSRIACLNTADDAEMEEYEGRERQIERLQRNIEAANAGLNKITTRMDRMQAEWLAPLNQLVREINLNFASAFERMGCAGEISVCTGENDKDFSQYGLSIKVTFRNGESLQELNSNIQSGGERAVATAAFMLALQELTPVPFRCVDEINQGMDANNERRIFELVVDCTRQQTSSQYFLITPKLVPHLNYSANTMVHIVHNGPFVAQDKKWGYTELCNPQRVQMG